MSDDIVCYLKLYSLYRVVHHSRKTATEQVSLIREQLATLSSQLEDLQEETETVITILNTVLSSS